MIGVLEGVLGRTAEKKHAAAAARATFPPPGLTSTDLTRDVGFKPATPIEEGIRRFVAWYREFYRIGTWRAPERPATQMAARARRPPL